jgi:hypothetical protein
MRHRRHHAMARELLATSRWSGRYSRGKKSGHIARHFSPRGRKSSGPISWHSALAAGNTHGCALLMNMCAAGTSHLRPLNKAGMDIRQNPRRSLKEMSCSEQRMPDIIPRTQSRRSPAAKAKGLSAHNDFQPDSLYQSSSSPLPVGERSDRDSDPGEGTLPLRKTVTPHPNPLPIEVGFIRLRQLIMPNSGEPELGGRGSTPTWRL